MDAIRVQNLRSLEDTGYISIKPITVLVGRNSSGKSTLVRTLPLLRQSAETRTTGPILWYGSFVDFGSFKEALRTDSSDPRISLSFKFLLPRSEVRRYQQYYWFGARQARLLNDLPVSVCLDLREDRDKGTTRAAAVDINLSGQRIRLEYERGRVQTLKVNSLDVLSLGAQYGVVRTSKFVPAVFPPLTDAAQRERTTGSYAEPKIAEAFVSTLRPYFHGNTRPERIRALLLERGVGDDATMLQDLRSVRLGGDYWRRNVEHWKPESRTFQRARDLVIAHMTPTLLTIVDSYLTEFAQGVYYIAPLRATAERYYRSQDLAVDEVDFQGKNLPMFLHSLPPRERGSFESWVQKRFGLSVSTRLEGGHISLRVTETRSGATYNLADVGFGFSQMLPVIAQLWAITQRERRSREFRSTSITLAIEQPELHLHPSLQALIADVLIDSVKAGRDGGLDLKVVIETHSEAIISRLGERIERGDLGFDAVEVVIFEKDGLSPTRVRLSNFDADGFLQDWPLGFFTPERA